MQTPLDEAAETLEYVPALQAEQSRFPCEARKVPGLQSLQSETPVAAAMVVYVPRGQAMAGTQPEPFTPKPLLQANGQLVRLPTTVPLPVSVAFPTGRHWALLTQPAEHEYCVTPAMI
jgi:hypothetical protein